MKNYSPLFLSILILLTSCEAPPEPDISAEIETPNKAEETSQLDPALCPNADMAVHIDNEPFRTTDDGTSYGQFSMTGTVISEAGVFPMGNKPITNIFLVVEDDLSLAFDVLSKQAEQLSHIDKMVDGKLYMKLGILENGELSSAAYLDSDSKAAILAALESHEKITLAMLQDIQMGSGAPANATSPCLIEAW